MLRLLPWLAIGAAATCLTLLALLFSASPLMIGWFGSEAGGIGDQSSRETGGTIHGGKYGAFYGGTDGAMQGALSAEEVDRPFLESPYVRRIHEDMWGKGALHMPSEIDQWVQQGGCMRLVHRMALDLCIDDLPLSPHARAHTGAGGGSSGAGTSSAESSSSSSSRTDFPGLEDPTPVSAASADLRQLLLSLLAHFSSNPHAQTRSPTAAAAAAFVKGDGGGSDGGGDGGGEGQDGRGEKGIHGLMKDVMWDDLWEQLSLRQQKRQGQQERQQQQQQQQEEERSKGGQQEEEALEQRWHVSEHVFPVNMSLQTDPHHDCTRMHGRHVAVHVRAHPAWFSSHYGTAMGLQGHHHCPRCNLSCSVSWDPATAATAHAHLHVRGAQASTAGAAAGAAAAVGSAAAASAAGAAAGDGSATSLPVRAPPLVVPARGRGTARGGTRGQESDAGGAATDAVDAAAYSAAADTDDAAGTAVAGDAAGAADGPGGDWDVLISYHRDSDVQLTYVGINDDLTRPHMRSATKMQSTPTLHLASRCSPTWRDDLASAVLAALPRHHSFGACRNNMRPITEQKAHPGCRSEPDTWQSRAHCVMSRYKFVLAIEGAVLPGYVTEKLFIPLEAGTVPIYYGAPDAFNYAPPYSFINLRDFSKFTQLAALIERLSSNTSEYLDYHAWRICGLPGNFQHATELGIRTIACRLCESVARFIH
ncbi:unnamed protein product [Closterium sp. NIES-53]